MKKIVKWLLIIIAALSLIAGLGIFLFIQSMKPDPQLENKVKQQAKIYVDQTFEDPVDIYDTLHDNMGNFPYFEYAAKARHSKDQTQFLVFFNETTKQMEDSYIADKWENELKQDIQPTFINKLGELDELWILYDERTGIKYQVNHTEAKSYQDYPAKPSILIFIPREMKPGDEQLFKEIIAFLKDDIHLQHAHVSLSYNDGGKILEDKEWHEEF